MMGIVPNYVGQLQLAAPFILAAIGVAIFLLVGELLVSKRKIW